MWSALVDYLQKDGLTVRPDVYSSRARRLMWAFPPAQCHLRYRSDALTRARFLHATEGPCAPAFVGHSMLGNGASLAQSAKCFVTSMFRPPKFMQKFIGRMHRLALPGREISNEHVEPPLRRYLKLRRHSDTNCVSRRSSFAIFVRFAEQEGAPSSPRAST